MVARLSGLAYCLAVQPLFASAGYRQSESAHLTGFACCLAAQHLFAFEAARFGELPCCFAVQDRFASLE